MTCICLQKYLWKNRTHAFIQFSFHIDQSKCYSVPFNVSSLWGWRVALYGLYRGLHPLSPTSILQNIVRVSYSFIYIYIYKGIVHTLQKFVFDIDQSKLYSLQVNVRGLCSLGPIILWKLRDNVAWVSATVNDWLKVLLI